MPKKMEIEPKWGLENPEGKVVEKFRHILSLLTQKSYYEKQYGCQLKMVSLDR